MGTIVNPKTLDDGRRVMCHLGEGQLAITSTIAINKCLTLNQQEKSFWLMEIL